jgi:hypothetical protein
VVVYNRNGEPAGVESPGYATPALKPASTIGLGYRPGTALRYLTYVLPIISVAEP